MEIVFTNGTDPRFHALCKLLDHSLDEAVGGHTQREEYDQYNGVDETFRVALFLDQDIPVACGSYKPLSADTAELKRVFTRDDYRGQGLAAMIVLELEKDAAANGYRFLVLETGKPLTAALRLYEKLAYEIIPNYGPYADMPLSICMRKEIEVDESAN